MMVGVKKLPRIPSTVPTQTSKAGPTSSPAFDDSIEPIIWDFDRPSYLSVSSILSLGCMSYSRLE